MDLYEYKHFLSTLSFITEKAFSNINDYENERKRIQEENMRITEDRNQMGDTIDRLNAEIAQLKETIKCLRLDKEFLKGSIRKYEEEKEQLEDEISRLVEENANWKKIAAEMEENEDEITVDGKTFIAEEGLGCTGCYFFETEKDSCPGKCSTGRKDGRSVIWKLKPETEPKTNTETEEGAEK